MATVSLVARVEAQVATFQKQFAEASRTAQKFEKDFANTASSVSSQQKRINDAFSSFSGDKLAREATAVAKAVEQIGGASKLTAAEQARVNAVVTESIAKYSALGQVAPKSLIDLEQATRKVEVAAVSTQKTTSLFGQSLSQLEQRGTLSGKAMGLLTSTFGQFTAAGIAVNVINKLAGELGRFVDQGVKLGPVQASFEKLSAGVGEDSRKMLSSLQGATRGMVSNYDLMLASNKALLLGLPVTNASMSELARTASVLGKAMGQDTTKSFDDLITALGRSSPLILDNLGLTVKVEEANQKYALALGKTADSLTDAEKKMAFYTEAMTKARERTQQIGEQTLTLGEIIQSVWTRVGNVVTGTISAINVESGKLITESVSAWSRIIGFVNSLRENGIRGAVAMALVNDQMARIAQAANAPAQAAKATEDLSAKAQRLTADLSHLTDQQRKNIADGKLLGLSNKEIADAMTSLAGKVKLTQGHLDLMDQIERKNLSTKRDLTKATKTAEQEADEIFKRVKKEADAREELSLWMGKNQAALKDYTTRKAVEQNEILTRSMDAATESLLMFVNARGFSRGGLPPIFDENGLQNIDMGAIFQRQFIDPAEKAHKKADELARGLSQLGSSFQQLGGSIGGTAGSIVSGIGGAIEGFAQLQRAGVTAFDRISGAAGGAAQVIASSGGTRTQNVAGAAAGGFATGAAIGSFFPGAGTAIGGAIGAGAGALIGFFRQTRDYKDAKAAVESFEQQLASTFTATERLALGNERWLLTATAVGNAYRDAGKSSEEAEAAVQRLFESSKKGSGEVALSILEIQAVMELAAKKQNELSEKQVDSAQAVEDATTGIRSRIAELDAEYNSLFKSIENEAPEKVMGDVERAVRARIEAIQQQSAAAKDEESEIIRKIKEGLGELGSEADTARQDMEDALASSPIRIPVEFVLPDGLKIPGLASGGIVRQPTLALIGESGPEAVVPLGSGGFNSRSGQVDVNVFLDGSQVTSALNNQYARYRKVSAA